MSRDVTYTARYTNAINKYTITWKNDDGSTLETDSLSYGTTPAYKGATPTKVASAQYSYAFKGWDKDISSVTGDTTYTASYTVTTNKYSITFKNGDSVITTVAVNYGENVTYSGATPSKEKDAQYSYIFNGWVDGSNATDDLTNVIADRTVYAHYLATTNSYTVTWKNDDGTTLKSDVLEYGVNPSYIGDRPAKAANDSNVYVFDGWEQDITPISKDVTYTAKYQTVENHLIYELSNDGGYHVSADKNNDDVKTITSLVIPDTYDDGVHGVKDVTAVDDFIMDGGEALTTLTIGANVESISDYTFVGCPLLSSVSVGNKIKSIDGMAFQETAIETAFKSGSDDIGYLTSEDGSTKYAIFAKSDLTSVSFDAKTQTIKDSLFQNNTSLTEATLDENLLAVPYNLFNGCSALAKVSLGSKITSIENQAFNATALLTNFASSSDDLLYLSPASNPNSFYLISAKSTLETAMVKEGTKLVANGAFAYNSSLTNVTLNDDLLSLEGFAFGYCTKLASIVIPSNVSSVGGSCFAGCDLLSSITLPTKIKTIESSTFESCPALTSISLPSSLEVIDDDAFKASGLTTIEIPNSIKTISNTAFYSCQSLASITMDGDNSIYQVAGNCVIEKDTHTLILGCNNSSIPSDGSVTSLGEEAFGYLTGLTSISIPASIVSIEKGCFLSCSNLESVSLLSGLKSISSSVFEGCKKLSSITLPSTLTSIGDHAFKLCQALPSLIIPSSVTSMEASIVWDYPVSSTALYCEAENKPEAWDSSWNQNAKATYWYSETSNTDGSHWHYVSGVPTVWIA